MSVSTAVDQSAVARALGIQAAFKNLSGGIRFLPQRVMLVGQGTTVAQASYSNTKATVFSAAEVGATYGYGGPLHLAAKMLFPENGDGVGTIPVTVYPLDDDGSGVASAGDITPSGSVSRTDNYIVRINNIDTAAFTISIGDTVAAICTTMTAAINAKLDVPVVATDSTTKVDLASKWKGASANSIVVEIVGPTDAGVAFALTQPVSGLTNPDVQDALDQVGDIWETIIVNCLEVADTTALAAYSTFGDGRWGALTKKPLVCVTGSTETSVTTAITTPESRKTDKTNCQEVTPGSNDLPCVIAARTVARIAKVANNKPAHEYARQKLSGLVPGTDAQQWTYVQRDAAVKGGSSTTEVIDGVINMSDTVTFYHPDGEEPPAYRRVANIIKIQNVIYNLDLIFSDVSWAGAPLIPDSQPTTDPDAKKPKMAKAAVAGLIDQMSLKAIFSDPKTAKSTILAVINDQNPDRVDVSFTAQLSGNSNIISIDFNFGFYFGSLATVS